MSRKLYIVLHIYKTAGQALRENFQNNFKPEEWLPLYAPEIGLDKALHSANPGWDAEQIANYAGQHATPKTKCAFGHMVYFGIHDLIGPAREPRYITFLRDPVERIVSLYYYLRNKSKNVWHTEIVEQDWAIDEWLEKSKGLWIYDGQLRQLLLGSYEEALVDKHLTRDLLEIGKRRLQKFWYVGLTETFDDDAAYLYGKLGFWRLNPARVVNATPGKQEIHSRTRELIAERNSLDIELHKHAQELRAKFTTQNAADVYLNKSTAAIKGLVFSAANSIWSIYGSLRANLAR